MFSHLMLRRQSEFRAKIIIGKLKYIMQGKFWINSPLIQFSKQSALVVLPSSVILRIPWQPQIEKS